MLRDVLALAVPEVLLGLKDLNKKSREAAALSLEALGALCEERQEHCELGLGLRVYGSVLGCLGLAWFLRSL